MLGGVFSVLLIYTPMTTYNTMNQTYSVVYYID